MIIQTSNPNDPIAARKLISRSGQGFDLQQAAELIVATLAKLPLLEMVQQSPEGVRSILLNPQIIDTKKMEIVGVGAQWKFEVQEYDDKKSLIPQLPLFLELVEEQMAKLPAGQRMEIVAGVSGERPRTRLNVSAIGVDGIEPNTGNLMKP